MGSAPDIVVISSDDEEEAPVAGRRTLNVDDVLRGLGFLVQMHLFADRLGRLAITPKLSAVEPPQTKGKTGRFGVGGVDGDEDDDCVVLDGDPDRPAVAVKPEKGRTAGCGSSDELEIVAEKGNVACRDFPHSRHSCSNLPFSTTSHMEHCKMCYCFVCDTPAPCNYWGKGLSVDDHCHATDKEKRWKILRRKSRCNNLPASGPENNQNAVYPTTLSQCQVLVPQSQPNLISDISLFPVARPDPLPSYARHVAVRTALDAEQTVSAARASPVARAVSDARNAQTAQIAHPVAEPGATLYVGNLPPDVDSEYLTQLFEYAGVVEDSEIVYDRETHQSRGYGFVTMSTVEEAEYAVDLFNDIVYVGNLPHGVDSEYLVQLFEYAGDVEYSEVFYDRETHQSRGYGFVVMSTVEEADYAVDLFIGSDLDVICMDINHGGVRAETPLCLSPSSSFKIFVCNLPWEIDDPWLEELFSEYGEVVYAYVVRYRGRRSWLSGGYGFVTMGTLEGRDHAIAALHKQVVEGRRLRVKVAKER